MNWRINEHFRTRLENEKYYFIFDNKKFTFKE